MTRSLPFLLVFLLSVQAAGATVQQYVSHRDPGIAREIVDKYFRTELYFGLNRSSGERIDEAEWLVFVDEVVTPRFPAGFTVFEAFGQYRDRSGKIVKEPSRVIVFFYSRSAKKKSRAMIEEIRSAYLKMFDQESVLRVDVKHAVDVDF